jgi:predicted MPP superfamily phosphohydrolase
MPAPIDRRTFLRGTVAAAGGAALATGAWAWRVAPYAVEIVERPLPIDALPPTLRGARLVQLSDLHVGPVVDDDYLRDVFARVTARRADIVAITGDFLTHRTSRGESQYAQLRDLLSTLPHGRLATVAVLGNHDYGPGWSDHDVARRVQREVERAGVQLLRNEVATVAGFDIVGVDELWARTADPGLALAKRSREGAIALCHNPDALDALAWPEWRGWILAGHTHGGQCRLPFLPPPVLPVRNPRYAAGEVTLADGRRLYVNRGIGHTIPVRFNVPPEITVFTLVEGRGDGRPPAGPER